MVRPLREEDLPVLDQLIQRCPQLGSERPSLLWLFWRFFPTTSWVVEREGRLAGAVLALPSFRESSTLYVYLLAVDPDFQGRGLGRVLLEQLQSQARAHLFLTTTPDNPAALAFYQRVGFEPPQPLEKVGQPRLALRRAYPEAGSAILARIERESGLSGLAERLANLPAGDLQSLLLAVYHQRSQKLTPPQVLAQYRQSRFTPASPLDGLTSSRLEVAAFECLPEGFETLELSPLAPLGACSVLGPVHQNKVVSTSRNLEVAADPTCGLAMECALRRRRGQSARLAASQRVVRAQALPGPGFYAHFRMLALASADRYSRAFQTQSLRQHLEFYLRLFSRLCEGRQIQVRLTDLGAGLDSGFFMPLRSQFPAVSYGLDPDREVGAYYRSCCFKLWVDDLELGDGGFLDWTARLLEDGRETMLSSGIGLERLAELCNWKRPGEPTGA
ncbi:MAG: GNAT family N-acetyltransferase [Vulcanimicrobiota bacterium]